MKYVIILILILFSCSPDWHIRRAKFKQPDILTSLNDTIKLKDVRVDTIYYADTFAVVHTITERDTVLETKYLKPDTRYQTRWKYKTIRDTVKIKERTKRIDVRQDNRTERKENRSYWYWWLIFGAIIGGIFIFWLRNILPF
jgi:hypothetical protein